MLCGKTEGNDEISINNLRSYIVHSLGVFFLWIYLDGKLSDFGLNAFTEVLGILVTVMVVDNLLKRRDEHQLLPQKAAAYEDVRLFTSKIISFWSGVYQACLPGPSPSSLASLFSESAFKSIGLNLNLDSQPNVIPRRTWWQWLPQNMSEHKKLGEVILERHNYVLDPAVYSRLHQLVTEGIHPDMIGVMRQTDIRSGFPRPHVLSCYFSLPEHYCENVLELALWCAKYANYLKAKGISGIKDVSSIGSWDENKNPPCRIDDDCLSKQIGEMKKFQDENKTLNI